MGWWPPGNVAQPSLVLGRASSDRPTPIARPRERPAVRRPTAPRAPPYRTPNASANLSATTARGSSRPAGFTRTSMVIGVPSGSVKLQVSDRITGSSLILSPRSFVLSSTGGESGAMRMERTLTMSSFASASLGSLSVSTYTCGPSTASTKGSAPCSITAAVAFGGRRSRRRIRRPFDALTNGPRASRVAPHLRSAELRQCLRDVLCFGLLHLLQSFVIDAGSAPSCATF